MRQPTQSALLMMSSPVSISEPIRPLPSRLPQRLSRRTTWLAVIGLTLLALLVNAWGIPKNLPYMHEVDEQQQIERTVRMATTGNLNPEWFGNPGSTLLYPMTAVYRLVFGPDSQSAYEQNFWPFNVIGRAISALYAILVVPLIFLIGRKTYGDIPGLIGAFLYIFYLIAVIHAQLIRTDSAGALFGLIALWRILEVDEQPSWRNQILAGLAVGLALSSRFFTAPLGLLLVAVDLLWWFRAPEKRNTLWLPALVGLVMAPVGFALTTPYFILDFQGAITSLRIAGRSTHAGADGLSRPQNLAWYTTQAIPQILTWPQYLLAIAGAGIVVARRRRRELLVLGYLVLFLITITLHALHWARWLIPVLPVMSLLVGVAIAWLAERFFNTRRAQTGFILVAVVLLAAWPAYQVILHDIRDSKPGTRVVAREWMIENIPAGSRIILEPYTPPLRGTDFDFTENILSLARLGTVDGFRDEGYDYMVVSDETYQRFYNEPDRYAEYIAFYEELFAEGELIQEFRPSLTLGGPTIRIYRLN